MKDTINQPHTCFSWPWWSLTCPGVVVATSFCSAWSGLVMRWPSIFTCERWHVAWADRRLTRPAYRALILQHPFRPCLIMLPPFGDVKSTHNDLREPCRCHHYTVVECCDDSSPTLPRQPHSSLHPLFLSGHCAALLPWLFFGPNNRTPGAWPGHCRLL